MKILVTGFTPFNKEKINPSEEVVKLLPKEINNCKIIKKIIPTVFDKSFKILKKIIDSEKPNIVICIGQAGGRNKITVERVAINIDDASIVDNENNMPVDKVIKKDGKNAYFSSLPIKAIIENLIKNDIPASISNSAGTFVCNNIMYNSLYYSEKSYNYKSGFIHIPFIQKQTINNNYPSMSLDIILKAIILAIETCINYYNKEDIKKSCGFIC